MKIRLLSLLLESLQRRWFQVAIVACLLILIRCWPMLAQGQTLYFADNYSLLVPGKIFTAEWIRQGVFPLWNPYIMGGLPWIGDVNQSVLYFSTLFFIWFSPATALNITLILHLLIAFVGMYGLAWSWTKHQSGSLAAAALWAASTHVSGSINNLTTIQSIVWIPWLIWVGLWVGKDRRAPVWFSLVVILQFAGGYPQHVLYGIGMAVLFSAFWSWRHLSWWSWLSAWLVTAVLSISLSAVIWLPFVEVLLNSTRMLQSTAQASVGSLDPTMLIKLLSPYFFDKSTAGMKWGPAWSGQPNVVFYVTWVGLGVIGAVVTNVKLRRREDWFLGIFCLATLVFALGENVPGFSLIQTAIPVFRVSRYPSMVLMLTNIALALWVASALARFEMTQRWYRFALSFVILSLVGAMVTTALSQWHFATIWQTVDRMVGNRLSSGEFHTLAKDQVIAQVISQSWLMASVLTLGAVWALKEKKWSLVVLFIMLDMLYHTQAMFFFAPAHVYPDQEAISPAAQLLPANPNYRWLTRNSNVPYTDYGSYWEAMVVRAPFSDSFVDAHELATTDHARRLRDGLTPNWNTVYEVPTIHGYTSLVPQDFSGLWETDEVVGINFIDRIELNHELLPEWSVGYYLVDTWFDVSEPLPGEPIATYENWQVYRLPALSRFRYEDESPIRLETFTENPNQIEFTFSNQNAAKQIIIADRYDRDWVATVNGQKQTIENRQGMRRLPVEPGTNSVLLQYQPRMAQLGVWISLAGGVAVIGWWLWASWQHQKQKKPVKMAMPRPKTPTRRR